MLSIPGYQITEQLHHGAKTLVYRAIRDSDHCPVVLKTLCAEIPAEKDLARLQHEYALTRDWDEPGLIRAHALLSHQNSQVLVLQDIGGVSVKQLVTGQPLPLARFLTLALAFAKSLGCIHQHQLIHKDINPSNLVLNPDTGQAQIIDFGISSQLSRETTQLQNPGHLEGTLAYLSPEQTGRMNRALDYRTDFYSLGSTFYEMLTGVPPFAATDPMELVHCHLARTPRPAHELRPELPPILNELVQKLMAKTAEARYQSAFGLIADLEICLQQFSATQSIESITPFPLGQHDVSERFQIPQKLYGRETQVQQVLDAFARVSHGQSEMLLVAGYSGVGKTALVHEVHKPITESRGYFIAGKFDQFQRDIPYAALIDAFQELIRQLLTESPARIAHWKAVLGDALGINAQVIAEVIPEVALILGPQPEVPALPPAQAQNRFNLVFQQFIRTFTTREHPLVLFLDDLQWADLPSLQLLGLFMSASNSQYLLLIGAYRDNEVHAAHPLMLALEEIHKAATRVDTITLTPLDEAHVGQLLAEALHSLPEQCQSLAELCTQKTQGNPFFLSQFLAALVEARRIEFDHANGRWQWDMATLQQSPMTDNVVELMTDKIQTLPHTTQAVLRLAACIGNTFDLNSIAWAWEQTALASAQAVWPALQEGLLVPLNEAYKYMTIERHASTAPGKTDAAARPNPAFKFAHDRVQQAAYSLIAESAKAEFHLRIGRRLLANLAAGERDDRIFDLVYHWNRGQNLLVVASEREQLAQLNLMAGQKALSSTAYKSALGYLQAGLELLGATGWETHYELTLALAVGATEAAYLSGNFALMTHLAESVLLRAQTLLDQVRVYQIQIQACILQDQALEAIKLALPVLKRLGVNLPVQPNTFHVLRAVLATKLALLGKPFDDLVRLPAMTLAGPSAIMQILSSIAPAAYFALPPLLPIIFCKQVQLSVKHGNSALSAYTYAGYGVILCGALGEIEAGYRFGKLAASTQEHFPAKALNAKIGFVLEVGIKHWKTPYRETLEPFLQVYQSGVQTGDFEYAAYAAYNYCNGLYLTGRDLNEVYREQTKYALAMVQFKQEATLLWQKIAQQATQNLLLPSDDPCLLAGASFDEQSTAITADNRTAIFMLHLYKLILCYTFQRYQEALEQAQCAERHLDAILSHFTIPLCLFYTALVQLALYPNAPSSQRRKILRKVASIQKKQKKWASHAPMNHLHKWHLVEAESARVSGADLAAMEHYDLAIGLAKQNGFPQDEALANELAARFYYSLGREKSAKTYLQDAYDGYLRWGAQAKVNHLVAQYPAQLSPSVRTMPAMPANPSPPSSPAQTVPPDASHLNQTSHLSHLSHISQVSQTTAPEVGTHLLKLEALDLASVMKASQAISGEIVLERLLATLMRIALESAGAERGSLLLEQDGAWHIEAEGHVNQEQISVLQSRPLLASDADAPELPVSLIQYAALTKQAVVLNNAAQQGRFTGDPYIIHSQARSVLCAPILKQGQLAGILYLENNLIEGAFTADRLEVLRILSSQAAISIENARVYANLGNTLHDLQSTQSQLVQSEKMAALGVLIAGVTHEINTPIGAIKSSGASIAELLGEALIKLPQLYQMLDLPARELFGQLIGHAKASSGPLSSREQRAIVRELTLQLEQADISAARNKAELLLELRAHLAFADFLPLLRHPESSTILDTARTLAAIINSANNINFAVERVAKIVLALKSFSRVSHTEEMIDARLQDGMETVLTIYNYQIKMNIKVVRNYEDIAPLRCLPDELIQVWTNLIHNALQAMEQQGTLTLGIRRVADEAVVSVGDSGTGIPEAIRSKIFDVFFTTKAAGVGSGLGLDIVKRIIDKHRGRIELQSEVGVGTTFLVYLPYATGG